MKSQRQDPLEEINRLLTKIDVDSEKLQLLENELKEEREKSEKLSKELENLKENKVRQSRQKTKILRERDDIVRDMSTELNTISARLKSTVHEKSNWHRKLEDSQSVVGQLHERISRLEIGLKNKDKLLIDKQKKIESIEGVIELYEQLKLQSKNEDWKMNRDRKVISDKAQKLLTCYQDVQKGLFKSEIILKKKFKNSLLISSGDTASKNSRFKCSCKSSPHNFQRRLNLLRTENSFLKRKVIKLLNQYCADQISISDINKNQSQVELSFYQKSVNSKTPFKVSGNSKAVSIRSNVNDSKRKSVRKMVEASFIEGSSVIGGTTFHVVTKRDLRKEKGKKDSEKGDKHFVSKSSEVGCWIYHNLYFGWLVWILIIVSYHY